MDPRLVELHELAQSEECPSPHAVTFLFADTIARAHPNFRDVYLDSAPLGVVLEYGGMGDRSLSLTVCDEGTVIFRRSEAEHEDRAETIRLDDAVSKIREALEWANRVRSYTAYVFIDPDSRVHVGHCPALDVFSQGRDESEALLAVAEACSLMGKHSARVRALLLAPRVPEASERPYRSGTKHTIFVNVF